MTLLDQIQPFLSCGTVTLLLSIVTLLVMDLGLFVAAMNAGVGIGWEETIGLGLE